MVNNEYSNLLANKLWPETEILQIWLPSYCKNVAALPKLTCVIFSTDKRCVIAFDVANVSL